MQHNLRPIVDRRTFLRSAAGSSALLLLPRWALSAEETSGRSILPYVTSERQKHLQTAPLTWTSNGGGNTTTDEVRLDDAQRYQPILGFGSAYTDSSCFLLSRMEPDARWKFLAETFSPQQMNLSFGRSTIGASDYSRNVYSYDDVPDDVALAHFSIAHDEEYILPMLREIRQHNPGLFLLSTPWSPPGWMKTYGSMLGGWMTAKYLEPYAHYIARFLDAYRKAGVEVNAVTSQNEVETDQSGNMPATYWTPEIEADFVRDHLGPLLKKTNSKTQIWLLDHNYNLWKRVKWQLQDPELRKYVDGVAWHGYVGTPDQMSRLHEVDPEVPLYWTEGGPDINDPKYALDWAKWGNTFTTVLNNWCRCIMTWNLILDEHGDPNIGPFSCGGLVTLRSNGELQHSGQYWALRHFSQHIHRGAIRLGSHSDATELAHIALRNPDGTSVLVLTNTGEERAVRLVKRDSAVEVRLERDSVTTLTW